MTDYSNFMHKDLAAGRWFTFSLVEQLANVGSEISRTILWKQKVDFIQSRAAFFRALELIHLTVIDSKNKGRRKEVLRARELLIDHFMYDNQYKTTDESWNKYFYDFGYAAALKRRRSPKSA